MKYQVVVEFDPESRHYTATVPGIPSIVVDAKSERTGLELARGAIAMFLEESEGPSTSRRSSRPPRRVRAKVVTVTV